MYQNLESRVFHSYLLQSAPEFCAPGEGSWQPLYNWTRNTYQVFTAHPELMMKELHEDDTYPWGMMTREKPTLKPAMRKSFQAMNGLLRSLWEYVLSGNVQGNLLQIADHVKAPPKTLSLLAHTGITARGRTLAAPDYPGMFSVIQELSFHPDGFQRFVRCCYQENAPVMISAYRQFSGDPSAYDKLVAWLLGHGYHYSVTLDDSEVKNFESSRISFLKSLSGDHATAFPGYDHDHFGFLAYFNALKTQPVVFRLFFQRVRDVIADFDNLDPALQRFIIHNHARCNLCGYCTQRSKGKQKPYTIYANYKGRQHALCPINYVYTYHWLQIDDGLADCIIAFLAYFERKFMLAL